MPVLSDSSVLVVLPSGNRAVYLVQPQHMSDRPGTSLATRARDYGQQLAHEHGRRWYRAGSWDEITDLRTIALLERAIDATAADPVAISK